MSCCIRHSLVFGELIQYLVAGWLHSPAVIGCSREVGAHMVCAVQIPGPADLRHAGYMREWPRSNGWKTGGRGLHCDQTLLRMLFSLSPSVCLSACLSDALCPVMNKRGKYHIWQKAEVTGIGNKCCRSQDSGTTQRLKTVRLEACSLTCVFLLTIVLSFRQNVCLDLTPSSFSLILSSTVSDRSLVFPPTAPTHLIPKEQVNKN